MTSEKMMPSEISARVVSRVKTLRLRRSMSMGKLAEVMTAAGYPMTKQKINQRENAGAKPTIDEIVGYTVVFGVSVEDLISARTCEGCDDSPPVGFTCNKCARTASPE